MFNAKLKLSADFSNDDIDVIGGAFDGATYSAMREGHNHRAPWTLAWMFDAEPIHADLIARITLQGNVHHVALPARLDLEIEAVPERDWLEYCYQQFPAFTVGPFFIYGEHHNGAAADGAMGLQINAATAFGSGEHGTTKGCLEAMVWLEEQGLCPWNILDMGTGSGILGIAAWKLWKAPVLAVDNDAEAVRVAEYSRGVNGVPAGGADMVCAVGDGFAAQIVQDKKPFELMIANILAGPLKEMAQDAAGVMDDNSYAVLSGILNEQAASVIEVYEAAGFTLKKQSEIGDWTTLILHYQ